MRRTGKNWVSGIGIIIVLIITTSRQEGMNQDHDRTDKTDQQRCPGDPSSRLVSGETLWGKRGRHTDRDDPSPEGGQAEDLGQAVTFHTPAIEHDTHATRARVEGCDLRAPG
jgi:hypothetical protein